MRGFTVGMLLSLTGPSAIWTPAAEAVTALAVEEINGRGGILGREVRVELIDAGRPLSAVRAQISELISTSAIDAIGGWHTSAVRHAVAPIVAGRIPYMYPAMYEDGERRAGMYCTGEVPSQQVVPAVRWLRKNLGLRRWFIVGDDYVWPRETYAHLREHRHELDVAIVGAQFLSQSEFRGQRGEILAQVIRQIDKVGPDGVLVLSVGQNAADFNRAFGRAGLVDRIVRFSPLVEENTLMASGLAGTVNLYSSAAYFRSLATADALELTGRYVQSNGSAAPALGAPSEACYEGLFALESIVSRARSTRPSDMDRDVDGTVFNGARGELRFQGNHVAQRVYLSRADGYDFDIIDVLRRD